MACGEDGSSEPDASSPDASYTVPPAEPADASSPQYYAFPCLRPRAPTGEATFVAIYADVFCTAGCTNPYCHGWRGTYQGLDLSSIENAYGMLIDQGPGQLEPVENIATCRESSLRRVRPYAPDESLLYLKLQGNAPCGTAMPPPGSGIRTLTDAELAQVRRWIAEGAPLGVEDAGAAQHADDASASTLTSAP